MLQILESFASRIGLTATRCPICSVLTDRAHGGLCLACADDLRPRTGGYCPGCGEMFGDEDTQPTLCGECRHTPQPWGTLAFHGVYAGTLRDLILGYKFNNGIGRTRLLADMAYTSFIKGQLETPDIIIPVPLHTRRLLWRGFNQSKEICHTLRNRLERPILTNGLVRIRHTQPQTRLDRKERKENIKAAFATKTSLVKGKTVLLVDDVYTTGATLRECTRTLKQAGVAQVDVLVLAKGL